MRAAEIRVLALAARHGRIAYVYLFNGEPRDWKLSCKGSQSPRNAAIMVGNWIIKFDPDVVIIEDPVTATRKGDKARALLYAMLRVAEKSPALLSKTKRIQNHCNKFDEAEAFAEVFPALRDKVPPRRRLWDPEPRNLIYFEALALAQSSGFMPKEQLGIDWDEQ